MTDPFKEIADHAFDPIEAAGVDRRESVRRNITDLMAMTRAQFLSPDSRVAGGPHSVDPDTLEEALETVQHDLDEADRTGMDIEVQATDSVNNLLRVITGGEDLMEG